MKKRIICKIFIIIFFTVFCTNTGLAESAVIPEQETLHKNVRPENPIIFKDYMENLQKSVKSHWYPPASKTSYSVIIRMTVDKNGNLLKSRVMKGTDSRGANKAALNAVKNAAPYEKFPKDAKLEKVDIVFTLDYNVHYEDITTTANEKIIKKIKFDNKEYKIDFSSYNPEQKYKRARYIPCGQNSKNYMELLQFNKMNVPLHDVYSHMIQNLKTIKTYKKLYKEEKNGVIYFGYKYELIGFEENITYDTYCFVKLIPISKNYVKSMEYKILIPVDSKTNRRTVISKYKKLVTEYPIPQFVNQNFGKDSEGINENRWFVYK